MEPVASLRFAGRIDPALHRRAYRLALGGVLPIGLVYALAVGALAAGLVLFLAYDLLVAGAAAFSLGLLGALVLAFYEVAVRRTWKAHRPARDRFEGFLDERGLRVTGPHGDTEIPWERLHRWKASRSVLLLYVSSRSYQVLARGFFATPGDWRAARALVARRLPGGQGAGRRRLLWIFLLWFLLALAATIGWSLWQGR